MKKILFIIVVLILGCEKEETTSCWECQQKILVEAVTVSNPNPTWVWHGLPNVMLCGEFLDTIPESRYDTIQYNCVKLTN